MRGETMKDKSKKSTYSTTFGVDPKSSKCKNGNMLLNKNIPAPPRGIEPRFSV